MKNIIIAIMASLLIGGLCGYLAGHRYATNKCEAETLRVRAETSDAIAEVVVDAQEKYRQIVADDAARNAEIERDFAELRRNYTALKKQRASTKNEAQELTQSDDLAIAHINLTGTHGSVLYAPNIIIADDLPVSDELRDYRDGAIRVILRAY
jgi:F0F1-type ATP synthase epsilon subunit